MIRAAIAGCIGLAGCTPIARMPAANGRGRLEALISASTTPSGDLSYVRKLDSHLQDLLVDQLEGKDVRRAAAASGIRTNEAGDVLVAVYVIGPASEAAPVLAGLGMEVAASNERSGVVEGYVPIDMLLAVAKLESTQAVLAAARPGQDSDVPQHP